MINVIGTIFGTSGYAQHTRYLANALNKLEPVRLLTNLYPNWERQVNDQELEMIKRSQKENYDTNLIITHPLNWRPNLNAKRNWVYLIWEGDKVPNWIVEECKNSLIDKIIVPSKHTYNALKTGIEECDSDLLMDKVVIIPHGVDLEIFKPIETVKANTFRFLANKGFRNLEDRGGLQYLIKAYLEEFSDEDVELVLKLNPAYGIPNLDLLLNTLKPNKVVLPKISIIVNDMTPKALNELYNQCDVFVSPTRAEAFNIPCLEALACNKPVITTNYGGQIDYCSNYTGSLIGYDLVEVEHELEYEGIKWATPKIKELRNALRYFYKNKKVNLITRPIAEKYSWDNTAKLIFDLKSQ